MRLLYFSGILSILVSTFACKSRDFNQGSTAQNVDAQTVLIDKIQNIRATRIEFSVETEIFIDKIFTKESDPSKVNWTRVEANGKINYTLNLPSSVNPTSQFACSRPKEGMFTATDCVLTFNNGSGYEVEGEPCYYTSEGTSQPAGTRICGFKRGDKPVASNAEGKAVYIDRILFTGDEAKTLYKSLRFNGFAEKTTGTAPNEKTEKFRTASWIECKVIPGAQANEWDVVNCALNARTGI